MLIDRLFQLLFWSAFVFALVMGNLPQPPALSGNPSDKVLHVLAFLVLAGLAAFAYPRVPLIVIFFGLVIFGGAIEIVQAVPELDREPSWLDWLADVVAAAAVLLAVGAMRFLRR
jgi:hypothetical protein